MSELVINFKLKAMEGDKVLARNYRKPSGEWEEGTVTRVEVYVYEDGRCWDEYTVVLDRRSASKVHYGVEKGGNRLVLYLHGKDISLLKRRTK